MSKGAKLEHERAREGVWGRRYEGTLEHERERTLARTNEGAKGHWSIGLKGRLSKPKNA